MLTVEDCLKALNDSCFGKCVYDSQGSKLEVSNPWDVRFVTDVYQHVDAGKPISTAQGEVAIKLITRYRSLLEASGFNSKSISDLLIAPIYRNPPYQSTNLPREVRWIGDNKLAFRCKFNAGIVEDIKKLKGTNHFSAGYPTFNKEYKLWIVDINSGNLEKAMDVIKRHRFSFDDKVTEFFLEASNSMGRPSKAEVHDGQVVITIRDDDFMNTWLGHITKMES